MLLLDGEPEAVTLSAEDAKAWKAEEVLDEDGYGERDYYSVKGWKALWMELGDDD